MELFVHNHLPENQAAAGAGTGPHSARRNGLLADQTPLEGRWRRVFENSAIGIALTDLEGRFLSANAAYQKMLGYSEAELQALTFMEVTHEDYREANRALVADLLKGRRQQFQIEKRYRRKDGRYIWVNNNVALVPGDASSPCCLMAMCEDITARKRAEQDLRRSEAYLNEAQSLSRTGSFGWNVATGDLVWSAETSRILGYDPALKPSVPLVLERVHPEDLPLVQQTIEHAKRAEAAFDIEHRLLMPDRSVKHIHLVARAARADSGEVEFVGALMDVSERKQSQDALRAANARFAGIVEIADDAIISVDSSQRIVLFNRGAEKVFGYAATELIGRPLALLLPPRFADSHRRHFEAFATAPEVSRSMAERREVFGRRKDGSEFPAEASISKLELGAETVFTVILRDVTERKQAAEALRAAAQLARGQTEALSRTLDALVMESAPDRLVEHVLRTIIAQLEAHSSGVWLRSETTGLVEFGFAFENGRLFTNTDADLAKVSPALRIENVQPWPEIFRTGKPAVLEDIRQGPAFPWREHLLKLGVVTILTVPMLVAGQVEGVIGIRFTRRRTFRAEEMELAQALAHQTMLAIQLMRLSRQSQQAAVAAERNRLARDIHDTLAQGFTGVIVQLEAAADANSDGLLKEANEHIARASDLARGSLREARRSVRALRPQALEEKGLRGALEELIEKMTLGTALRGELALEGEPRALPSSWGENLLRIGQEVLTNSLRHAAASEFKARLSFDRDAIRLTLRDNGHGFDPIRKHDGFGLLGIRERVEGMGGQLTIQSGRNEGTAISIILHEADMRQPFMA
jgi:PAS domain S-box-containing protein